MKWIAFKETYSIPNYHETTLNALNIVTIYESLQSFTPLDIRLSQEIKFQIFY